MRLAGLLLLSLLMAIPPLNVLAQSDGTCTGIVIPLMNQSGLDAIQYGPVLGCEQVGPSWRMRTVSEISFTNGGDAETEQGRKIQNAVDLMSMNAGFANSVRFDRNSSSLITIGAQSRIVTSDISDQGIGLAPNWLNNYIDIYTRDMETYLLNNAGTQSDLFEYMYWFIGRRDATLQTMSLAQNPMASSAFLQNWGYGLAPWPWQLADPVAIEEYVRLFEPVSSTSEPTETPANSTEYSEPRTFYVGVIACDGNDCEYLVGVKINYASADGVLQGYCVTEIQQTPNGQSAWCDYLFLDGVPTILTVDQSTLPPGYTLTSENPMTFLFPENPDGELSPVYFQANPA